MKLTCFMKSPSVRRNFLAPQRLHGWSPMWQNLLNATLGRMVRKFYREQMLKKYHWKPMFQQVTNISNIQSLGDVWGGTMFILSCEKFQGSTVLLNSKFMTSYTSLSRFHSSMHELTLEKLTDHRKKYVYIVCHFKVSWCFRRFDSYSLVIWLVYLLFLLWNFATPENNKKHMVTTFQLRANAPCTRSICTMSWQSKADLNRWLNVSSSCKGIFSLR